VLLSLIANVNRDPRRTKVFKPSDFDPYANKKKKSFPVESLSGVRRFFEPGNVVDSQGSTDESETSSSTIPNREH